MKTLLLGIFSFIFYNGFFTFSKSNTIILSIFTDKQLHFAVFFLYPLVFLYFLPKNKIITIITLLFFGTMTFGIEVLQRKYFHRTYSMLDFKYSFCGFLSSCLVLLILNTISYFGSLKKFSI
jgi:hypothetical protein